MKFHRLATSFLNISSLNIASVKIAAAAILTLTLCSSAKSARAQGGHHLETTPTGGKISYGVIDGATTEAQAMGTILKSLHQQTGDRPKVGKLFQIQGSQSVGVFVSVSKAKIGGPEIGGLIIATKVSDDVVEAAMVSDDAAKFPKTLAPMMKTLSKEWHPLAGSPSGSGKESRTSSGNKTSVSVPAAKLQPYRLPDNSASVGLPPGWQIAPQMSGGGTIVASDQNQDTAELGIGFLAMDTNNPTVQHTLQQLRMGQLRGTSYATAAYVPYGADLTKTFEYLLQDKRKRANLAPATYNFTSAKPSGNNYVHCVALSGTADFHDQSGLKEMSAVFCAKPPDQTGNWLSSAYMTTTPIANAPKMRNTLAAMMQSFQENSAVIDAQAAAIAKPAVDAIHAYGDMVIHRAQDSEKAFEIRNSSVYKQWDSNDKRSQEFSNSTLGYSVIADTNNNAHGTFWDEDAEALVKSHPERFEYVQAPNYWKGIDY